MQQGIFEREVCVRHQRAYPSRSFCRLRLYRLSVATEPLCILVRIVSITCLPSLRSSKFPSISVQERSGHAYTGQTAPGTSPSTVTTHLSSTSALNQTAFVARSMLASLNWKPAEAYALFSTVICF